MDKIPKHVLLKCCRCNLSTAHALIGQSESDYEYIDAEGSKCFEPATYRNFQCNNCSQVSLYVWSAFNNPLSNFGEQVYPVSEVLMTGTPTLVNAAYMQALEVKPHSKVAYLVLARRVLDAIVNDQKLQGRNLADALSIWATKGGIPPLLVEATDIIRKLGNQAAHEVDNDFNELHVQLIEKSLTTLIEYIYIMPDSFHELKSLLNMEMPNGNKI